MLHSGTGHSRGLVAPPWLWAPRGRCGTAQRQPWLSSVSCCCAATLFCFRGARRATSSGRELGLPKVRAVLLHLELPLYCWAWPGGTTQQGISGRVFLPACSSCVVGEMAVGASTSEYLSVQNPPCYCWLILEMFCIIPLPVPHVRSRVVILCSPLSPVFAIAK